MASKSTEALNEEAAAWFARLQNSAAPDSVVHEFEQWIDADPAHAVAFARVEATWERTERLGALGSPPAVRATRPDPVWLSRRAAAAALVTLAVGGAGGAALLAARRGQTYATKVGERRTVALADGSSVTLNTDSEIKVSFSRDRRDLQLKRGEALFEVAKDPSRPFVVAAGDASVRAVGTAFNIRLRDKLTEVTVTEGVVAVHDRRTGRSAKSRAAAGHVAAGAGAVVAPGAVASIKLDSEALKTRLAWRQGVIELRGETLEQAVAEFNRYSDRKLVIGDPRIASIRVGGEFGINESDKFVEALKTGFNVRATAADSGDIYLVSSA